jgi:acyl-coenzyme A thioesterase PaaI-like protein
VRRAIGFTSLATFAFVIGASIVPVGIASAVTPDTIPTDAQTLQIFQPPDEATQKIEDYIRTHPLAQKMRSLPNYTETRPHLKFPQQFRGRHLIAGTLLGPNRMVIPPYVFYEKSGKDLVAITYLGQEVCGHPGIVHGGMLATMLDEGLARCCLPVLPNGIGVTAKLSVDYKKPVIADRYVVLRAETTKHDGRKAWVKGRLETLPEGDEEPVVLVEAEGLFIEPKYASVSFLFFFPFLRPVGNYC